jgi:hypothetical protein
VGCREGARGLARGDGGLVGGHRDGHGGNRWRVGPSPYYAPHAVVYRARVAELVRKVTEGCESLSLDNPTDREILIRQLVEALT